MPDAPPVMSLPIYVLGDWLGICWLTFAEARLNNKSPLKRLFQI